MHKGRDYSLVSLRTIASVKCILLEAIYTCTQSLIKITIHFTSFVMSLSSYSKHIINACCSPIEQCIGCVRRGQPRASPPSVLLQEWNQIVAGKGRQAIAPTNAATAWPRCFTGAWIGGATTPVLRLRHDWFHHRAKRNQNLRNISHHDTVHGKRHKCVSTCTPAWEEIIIWAHAQEAKNWPQFSNTKDNQRKNATDWSLFNLCGQELKMFISFHQRDIGREKDEHKEEETRELASMISWLKIQNQEP